jgi:ubiquinol-cytochrome c reductase cytochrome c1 subunit
MLRKGGFLFTLLAALPLVAAADGGEEAHMRHMDVHLDDTASLQRGAKYFVNYCQGCHSAKYQRYSRLAQDLELSPAQVEQNLIFTGQKVGETMISAMQPEDGEKWFGEAPPDLSLVARSDGVDWLYSYLHGFYLDPERPFGVNNIVYDGVSMPHVLGQLQGWQKPVYKEHAQSDEDQVIDHLELAEPGLMTPKEYDQLVRDLVSFLAYTGEPAQLARARVGSWVMLFLLVLLALSYALKKEYWKDVH